MKKTVVIILSAILFFVSTMFISAEVQAQERANSPTVKTQVIAKPRTTQFKGLKTVDVSRVEEGLNTPIKQVILNLADGNAVLNQKKDCTRIDLTDKKACIAITIEDIDDEPPPPPPPQ